MRIWLFFFSTFLCLQYCNSSKLGGASLKNEGRKGVNLSSHSETLVDQLRKVSGINIEGDGVSARITIRGKSSLFGDSEPLFLVNNQALTGGLKEAMDLIPVSDIQSIAVLKNPSETAIYGVRGANGVIVITLK